MEYRDSFRTHQTIVRPGAGGFRVDLAVPFRSGGLPINTAHTRAPPSPPSYASYRWGRAPHTAAVVGNRIDVGVGRPTLQYTENQ
jgi:hypothetical protein